MLSKPYLSTEGDCEDHEFEQINMASYLPITEAWQVEIRRETGADLSLQKLKSVVTQGWPDDKQKLEEEVRPFFSVRDELSEQDGLFFRGQRTVILQSLHPMIKQKLHSSHMGVDSVYVGSEGQYFGLVSPLKSSKWWNLSRRVANVKEARRKNR